MHNINTFLTFLEQKKGQKPRTIQTNFKLIRKILTSVIPLDREHIQTYIDNLITLKKSPSYIKQHVSLIRQWAECHDLEDLKTFPYPKLFYKSTFQRAVFADEELLAFLNLKNPHKKGSYHDRYEMWIIFYTILFWHGLRTMEIAQLTIDNFDFGLGIINITAAMSKTGVARVVPISPDVRDKLYAYVNDLDQPHLFPSFHKATKEKGVLHVSGEDWRGFFKKQMLRLGIKRHNLTPYSGRHSYGTRMAEEGVHLSKIKSLMGHSQITTTEKYIHLGLKSLKEVQDNDRLRVTNLPFNGRYSLFREIVRKALRMFAKTPQEEKRMLSALLNLP